MRYLDRCRLLGASFGSSLIRVRDASVHLSSYIFVIFPQKGFIDIHQSIDFEVNVIDDTVGVGGPAYLHVVRRDMQILPKG